MKITMKRLKEIIREELVTEADIDKKVDTKEIVKRMMKNFKGQYAWVGKAWSKELLRKYKKGMSQTDFIIDAENLKNTFGGQGIDTIFKGLNEKVFGSQAQYDAYRKKNNLKPGSKHKVAGKTVTVRGKGKISKAAAKKADKFAAAQNAKMDAAEKMADKEKNKNISKKDKKTLGKISKMMKMANEGSEKIPGELKRYMDKFLIRLKDRNLVRAKKKEVLKQVLQSLSISPKELMMYIQRVKREI